MNRTDKLLDAYRNHIQLPLRQGLPAVQRVWFAVYPPDEERRIVNRLDAFEIATKEAGHSWVHVELKGSFARWLGLVDPVEREEWFKNPGDIELYAKTEWRELLTVFFHEKVAQAPEGAVVALTGLMELYDFLHVSELIESLLKAFPGYLLVFFPGEKEGNTYRFLDARAGWDYLAVPILSEK